MKTPKAAGKAEKNAFSTPSGGKIKKNKFQGKNQPGGAVKIDAAKAKLTMTKGQDNLKLKDSKALPMKKEMKNKVFNGKPSPNGSAKDSQPVGGLNSKGANKKRKVNDAPANVVAPSLPGNSKKSKKNKGLKSQEVQLGLTIEKLLESPKIGGAAESKKKNKKKGKGPGANAQVTPVKSPEAPNPGSGSPGQGKKRKRKGKGGNQAAQGGSPIAGQQVPQGQKAKQPSAKVDFDAPIKLGSFPNRHNTENAIKALISEVREVNAKKPSLLDEFDPIFVVVDFFKYPEAKRIERALLPNAHLGPNPDVIFIATDSKKAKKEPEESVEFHKQLFSSSGVSAVPEVIPWRRLMYEYTQYEEKRKLANRGDAFLIDSKLSYRWPAIMRKKTMRRKAPIPLRLEPKSDLKKNFETALRKTAILLGPKSISVQPQIGNTKMNFKALADNLITVLTVLCDETKYPGGRANIRHVNVKTARSASFPIFMSTASPNTVEKSKPVEKKKKEVVEGEVTTAGAVVAVYPSGVVKIKSKDVDEDEVELDSSPKKRKIAEDQIDSEDDESEVAEGDEDVVERDEEEDDESEVDEDVDESDEECDDEDDDDLLEREGGDDELIKMAEEAILQGIREEQAAISQRNKLQKNAGKLQQGKNVKPAFGGKPPQNGFQGKGKQGFKQQQSPKGGAPNKKGPQGGKGSPNQKGNKKFNKGSPKPQQRYFNTKAGSKRK